MGSEVESRGGIQLFQGTRLPPEWEFKVLGSMCTIRRGASPRPAGDPKYFGNGTIPWIKIGDVTKTGGRYVESTAKFVNEEGAKRSVRIAPESLIIANSGVSLGFAAFTKVEGCIHDGWLLASEFEGLDRYFLFYCINILTNRLRTLADGTTQPNLNTSLARQLLIPTPPLPEQKAIAHILGTLDDRIELNQRMNETLEAMAQALFKSWFVDCDPVIDNALASGKEIPVELRKKAQARAALGDKRRPLPEKIRTLFPDEFTYSDELGWVPRGWEVRPLYDIANFINGAAFKSAHFSIEPTALPVIKIAEIKNGISGQTKFTTETFKEKYRIDDGEILFSWSGNPDTSIDTFIWNGGPGWLNQHIFKVSLKSKQDHNFVFYQLKTLRPVFAEIARNKQTTGLGHVTVKDMKNLYVPHPTDSLLQAFNLYSVPLFGKWYVNLQGNEKLIDLRDTLLPKLLSGELRIPDVEKMVEELA